MHLLEGLHKEQETPGKERKRAEAYRGMRLEDLGSSPSPIASPSCFTALMG